MSLILCSNCNFEGIYLENQASLVKWDLHHWKELVLNYHMIQHIKKEDDKDNNNIDSNNDNNNSNNDNENNEEKEDDYENGEEGGDGDEDGDVWGINCLDQFLNLTVFKALLNILFNFRRRRGTEPKHSRK